MILFRLKCASDHEFEGWFRDNDAFDRQQANGDLACPVCGDKSVDKALMAPRLGRSDKQAPSPAEMRRALQELRKQVETHCDYVGPGFAEEARKIHRGETPVRGIYGEATQGESRALADEGIEVACIPWVPPNDA
jgi:hypothetical protein